MKWPLGTGSQFSTSWGLVYNLHPLPVKWWRQTWLNLTHRLMLQFLLKELGQRSWNHLSPAKLHCSHISHPVWGWMWSVVVTRRGRTYISINLLTMSPCLSLIKIIIIFFNIKQNNLVFVVPSFFNLNYGYDLPSIGNVCKIRKIMIPIHYTILLKCISWNNFPCHCIIMQLEDTVTNLVQKYIALVPSSALKW